LVIIKAHRIQYQKKRKTLRI